MKLKLVCAAVAAAVMAAPASAGVKLYGHAHGSVDWVDNGTDSGIAFSSNSSRLGVKYKEDLGNGLTAVGKMEWHVSLTDDKDLKRRNRYVGLAGGFGTVLLGRHDTPMKIIGRKVDLFNSTQLGENRAFTAADGFDARVDNVLVWITPASNGVNAIFAYIADLDGDNTDEGDNTAVSGIVMYKSGGVMLAGGWEKQETSATTDHSAVRLVGKFTSGANSFTGFYQAASDVGGTVGHDRDVVGVGFAHKAGKNTFKAHYYSAGDFDDAADTGGSGVSLGIDHALSKKTKVYVTACSISNDSGAKFGCNAKGHDDKTAAPAAGLDSKGLSFGMLTKF